MSYLLFFVNDNIDLSSSISFNKSKVNFMWYKSKEEEEKKFKMENE